MFPRILVAVQLHLQFLSFQRLRTLRSNPSLVPILQKFSVSFFLAQGFLLRVSYCASNFCFYCRFFVSYDADRVMAEFGLGLPLSSSVACRNSCTGISVSGMLLIGSRYRFRFQSAVDSYSIASEAFSEQRLALHPILTPIVLKF